MCVKEQEVQYRAGTDAAMWTKGVKMPSCKCQAVTQHLGGEIVLKVLSTSLLANVLSYGHSKSFICEHIQREITLQIVQTIPGN